MPVGAPLESPCLSILLFLSGDMDSLMFCIWNARLGENNLEPILMILESLLESWSGSGSGSGSRSGSGI